MSTQINLKRATLFILSKGVSPKDLIARRRTMKNHLAFLRVKRRRGVNDDEIARRRRQRRKEIVRRRRQVTWPADHPGSESEAEAEPEPWEFFKPRALLLSNVHPQTSYYELQEFLEDPDFNTTARITMAYSYCPCHSVLHRARFLSKARMRRAIQLFNGGILRGQQIGLHLIPFDVLFLRVTGFHPNMDSEAIKTRVTELFQGCGKIIKIYFQHPNHLGICHVFMIKQDKWGIRQFLKSAAGPINYNLFMNRGSIAAVDIEGNKVRVKVCEMRATAKQDAFVCSVHFFRITGFDANMDSEALRNQVIQLFQSYGEISNIYFQFGICHVLIWINEYSIADFLTLADGNITYNQFMNGGAIAAVRIGDNIARINVCKMRATARMHFMN